MTKRPPDQKPGIGGVMKQVLISTIVATVVVMLAFVVEERFDDDGDEGVGASTGAAAVDTVDIPASISLSYTVEPPEDSWVAGARSTGADDRMLSDSQNSICFLTKVEVAAIQSPEDRGSCRIAVDDFTGFWKVTAEVPEGSQSEIRCNARCLAWDEGE
jgi:hypothetical protein